VDSKVTRVTTIPGLTSPLNEEACLVQIYGPMLGKKFVLEKDEITIGRGESCEIVLDLENVSRRHCSLLQRTGGVFLRDNGSTNGTYLNNVEVRGETPLRSGDLLKVGGAIFKFLLGGELGSIEAQYHEEIYRLTIIDGLTEVYNKRYLLEFLDREMARCLRHRRALSLVLFDIDLFKKINDTYGHLAGDYVLRELAQVLKSSKASASG
jgi:predicted signal transduction protein with EAL and GGDEF domain